MVSHALLDILASIGVKTLKALNDDEIKELFKLIAVDPWIVGFNRGAIVGLSVGTDFLVPSDSRTMSRGRSNFNLATDSRHKNDLVLTDRGLEIVKHAMNNFDDPVEAVTNRATFRDGNPLQFSNGDHLQFSNGAKPAERVSEPGSGFEEQTTASRTSIDHSKNIDSASWTGMPTGTQRVRAVQTLMPTAMASIEALIAHMEGTARHNGGPPLIDEFDNTLTDLRNLHRALGDILTAADEGVLDSNVADGLMAEASKYIRRTTDALRADPLPYALSITIFAVLTACGIPDIGGYVSTLALQGTKSKVKRV